MKNSNFTQGFVEACIGHGLGIHDVRSLLNKQACVDLFNNDAFAAGFKSIVGDKRYTNMTVLEKAACIESLKRDLANDSTD
jgi:hypothetical protein